ncbi:MAG: metallophosphoesterase [Anaerolineaceae bacterium]|nr:metallophosphoesterase [Anaerolineaceae bacterium]
MPPLLRFIHISDTHISPDPDYHREYTPHSAQEGARALVRELNALPFTPDFVLHTGDVAYNPDPDAYPTCRDILGAIRYPVYYLAGNHDDSAALQRILLRHEDVLLPFHYTFAVNGVLFACVDSNGPAEPPRGYVTDEQLAWLAGICAADDEHPLVVAVHHNVLPVDVPWLDDYMPMVNGEAFHAALLPAKDRLRGVFHGHTHQQTDTLRDGILYSSVASSWSQFHGWPEMTHTTPDSGAEPGYNMVTITPDQTFIRRCRFAV